MTGTCQGEGNWSMGSVLLAVASITKVSAARSANQSPRRDVAIRPSLTGKELRLPSPSQLSKLFFSPLSPVLLHDFKRTSRTVQSLP